MRSTIFCKHFRSMSEHETCEAGVAYESLKGIPFDARPCFSKPGECAKEGCSLVQLPTAEEVAEEDAMFRKLFERTDKARAAIVSYLGGPWKRGMQGSNGTIDCPACGAKDALSFSRSGYNGHIHASCETEDCVRWME